MIKNVEVKLKENSYPIIISHKIFSGIGVYLRKQLLGQDAIVITNRYIHKTHGRTLIAGLKSAGCSVRVLEVADSEQSKSSEVAVDLLNKIAAADIIDLPSTNPNIKFSNLVKHGSRKFNVRMEKVNNKNIFIVAFGGGVVGDLAGFVAAIYKRGVPYIQVPTTFLAQIDSSIGGKVAIDLPAGKNLAGAFYHPRFVLSDVSVLATLDKRQMRNGLAEAVKYGVICDQNLFDFIDRHYQKLIDREPGALEHVILECSRIKADVVRRDEKETKGLRMILNFGHTFGHAIETAGGYDLYHHGEAVALGMRIAADMACRLKLLRRQEALRLENLLTKIGLPKKIERLGLTSIMAAMAHDKKFQAGKNRFVLPVRIGKVKIVEGVSREVIEDSIKAYMNV